MAEPGVPPALSAEEWAAQDGSPLDGYVDFDAQIVDVSATHMRDPSRFAAALCALANAARPDGDAGKLTPAMVRQLRELAAWHDAYGGPTVAEGVAAIADAIAALLPPPPR